MSRYDGSTDVFKYRGYIYCPEDDVMEDNIKRYHSIYLEHDGIRVCIGSVPLSPYEELTLNRFKRWIQCGQPTREDMGGHHNEDHDKYWQKMYDESINKILTGHGHEILEDD
jgi:hypothetical protein